MIVTAHSNKLTSSTNPAEKPSTGLLVKSAFNRMRVAATPSHKLDISNPVVLQSLDGELTDLSIAFAATVMLGPCDNGGWGKYGPQSTTIAEL